MRARRPRATSRKLVYPVETDMAAMTKKEAARDLNDALQVAAKIPMARRGSIELRPSRSKR
jgi:hypothetical protein